MGIADEDAGLVEEVRKNLPSLQERVETLEVATVLNKPDDIRNAIVNINSGSGGTESQDWAQMLYRMYTRWAERSGFSVQVIDVQMGEEAGIKSVTFTVNGPYAYGYMKAESGVHRLVRISPFDSNARRHTSFSSMAASPEVDDDFEVDIKDGDLRVDVFRSGGAGGQSVNTADSAVRLTHLASGIVVVCQQERSQQKNRALAMKVLKSRLYEKHLAEQQAKIDAINKEKKANEWGSQIRSYVLAPYKLVKDHRTGVHTSQTDSVLDGDIQEFIRAQLLGIKKADPNASDDDL